MSIFGLDERRDQEKLLEEVGTSSEMGMQDSRSAQVLVEEFITSNHTSGLLFPRMSLEKQSRSSGKERDAETGLDYFGARYYGSNMGRWMSPDWATKPSAVPYAQFGDPQSLNLYSYVRNSPISKSDPDGHCEGPSNLSAGQVGVCIAAYIQTKTVGVVGAGDGRGPKADGGSYRTEVVLVVDTKKGTVAVAKDDAGISRAAVVLGKQGTSNTTLSKPTTDDSGNTHFRVTNEGLNGLAGVPGAPTDTIKTNLNLVVTPDGKVGTDPGGTRTPYPSLEVYSYTPDGKSKPVLQIQEQGNPYEGLKQDTQKIPTVTPQ